MRLDVGAIMMALCLVGQARGEATCQMQEIGELPVTVDGQVTIDAQVNGQPVRMIVDTGSAGTLLTHPAAAQLGLVLRPIPGLKMYGVGGGENGASARVKEFKVANLVDRNFDMLVQGPHLLGEAQGVLGALFLMQADVEFDFPHDKLRFFAPKNCKGDQVVYWGSAYSVVPMLGSSKGSIEVNVLLNGKPVRAQMDTGASVTTVTPAEATNAGVKITSDGISMAQMMGGLGRAQVRSYAAVFPSFSFGDETIHNAKITIADMFREDKEVALGSRIATAPVDFPEMLLGDDFFRSHRVYVSLSQRKVYASYVGGPVFSAPAAAH
jgi:predicted aspartyl protease